MTYTPIRPPFNPRFTELPKKELREYFRWFLEVLPLRIKELAEEVKQTPRFESWEPDFTPASLEGLGEWFATQVDTRKRTETEIQAIKDRLLFPVDISDKQLTGRTQSLAMDIGMYFSQVFLKNHPSLKWEQVLGSKRFADYGQALLSGFGRVRLNPVGLAYVFALGLARKNKTGGRLRELYEIWSKDVQ